MKLILFAELRGTLGQRQWTGSIIILMRSCRRATSVVSRNHLQVQKRSESVVRFSESITILMRSCRQATSVVSRNHLQVQKRSDSVYVLLFWCGHACGHACGQQVWSAETTYRCSGSQNHRCSGGQNQTQFSDDGFFKTVSNISDIFEISGWTVNYDRYKAYNTGGKQDNQYFNSGTGLFTTPSAGIDGYRGTLSTHFKWIILDQPDTREKTSS